MLNLERLEERDAPAVHVQVITVIGIPASDWHRELFIWSDTPHGVDKMIPIHGPDRLDFIHLQL